jgi:hypothetical protein
MSRARTPAARRAFDRIAAEIRSGAAHWVALPTSDPEPRLCATKKAERTPQEQARYERERKRRQRLDSKKH